MKWNQHLVDIVTVPLELPEAAADANVITPLDGPDPDVITTAPPEPDVQLRLQ